MSADVAVGIDLGGTRIKAALVTAEGEIIRTESRPTNDGGAAEWRPVMRELLATFDAEDRPIGVAAPGLVRADGRAIASMPGRLAGIVGLEWTRLLETRFAVPVCNDAQAALVAEAWVGAARPFRHAILLTLGTGVGGAVLIHGEVWRGSSGRAGHFGHTCLDPHGAPSVAGMPGALEQAIGECSLRARTGGVFTTTRELIDAAKGGHRLAREVWQTSVRALACAVGSFINILDPEAVILGGGIAAAGEELFTPLREELRRVEWRPLGGEGVEILPAQLGEWAGAIGAARLALRENAA